MFASKGTMDGWNDGYWVTTGTTGVFFDEWHACVCTETGVKKGVRRVYCDDMGYEWVYILRMNGVSEVDLGGFGGVA